MKKILVLSFFTIYSCWSMGQVAPIDLTEKTIKLSKKQEEKIYYAFIAGDKIVLNLDVVEGKELPEFEIIEYPSNTRFSDYKINKITGKSIDIYTEGIYVFILKNPTSSEKIIKLKIQRLPKDEISKQIIPNIKWVEKKDTVWSYNSSKGIMRYDTTYIHKKKKVLAKIDTVISVIFDEIIKVPPVLSLNSASKVTVVNFPKNTYEPHYLKVYKSTEFVAWSYWIGVGQQSLKEYEKANKQIMDGIKIIGTLTGYKALASLLVTGISIFGQPVVGENVKYTFYDVSGSSFQTSNAISSFGRNDKVLNNKFTIHFYNDNGTRPIEVHLKVVGMQLVRKYEDKIFTEMKVTPQKGQIQNKTFQVKTEKVPEIITN